jgi:hypothetical protein
VVLCDAWVRFEREHGSADDQLHAELKIEPIMAAATAAAAAAADANGAAMAQVCASPSWLPHLAPISRIKILMCTPAFAGQQLHMWQSQAAAEQAPKLTPEEMKRLRQERDPNFRKSQSKPAGQSAIAKAESDAAAMPPPPSRLPPKRKKGLGYQVGTPIKHTSWLMFVWAHHTLARCGAVSRQL